MKTMETKQELLKKVWNECSFDEIIDAGFECNKCSAMNLKVAASEFDDPNKEYDSDDLKNIIVQFSLSEVVDELTNQYNVGDIAHELATYSIGEIVEGIHNNYDILECIDNDDLMYYLEDTFEMDEHDEGVKETGYKEGIADGHTDLEEMKKNFLESIHDNNGDSFRILICDLFGIGYYDDERLYEALNKLVANLNKSTYKTTKSQFYVLKDEK